jgi:general secretion pathway protein G
MTEKHTKGFTLIELLVVVAIISLLSSIVMSSLTSARVKAKDSKIKEEFHQLQQALYLYYDKHGKYPNETPVGASPWSDNFNSMAQQLVSDGVLGSVPTPPANNFYLYYNYGPGNSMGALVVSYISTLSTTGVSPSCRPWAAGTNWCSQSNTSEYCLCNPY